MFCRCRGASIRCVCSACFTVFARGRRQSAQRSNVNCRIGEYLCYLLRTSCNELSVFRMAVRREPALQSMWMTVSTWLPQNILSSRLTGSCMVQIFQDGTWKNLPAELVGHGAGSNDITVLAPVTQLSVRYPLHATTAGLTLGQDVLFLGFPYGLANELGELNNYFPVPLVKKGIVSALQFEEARVLLLDGHNNPGFSGGPVVYQSTTDREGSMTVVGRSVGLSPDI